MIVGVPVPTGTYFYPKHVPPKIFLLLIAPYACTLFAKTWRITNIYRSHLGYTISALLWEPIVIDNPTDAGGKE